MSKQGKFKPKPVKSKFISSGKVKKALLVDGPSYIQVNAPCITGWTFDAGNMVEISRLAVETGIFPLYEIDHGRYKLSMEFSPLRPIVEYTKLQGRFRHLTADVLQQIQDKVVQKYDELRNKTSV